MRLVKFPFRLYTAVLASCAGLRQVRVRCFCVAFQLRNTGVLHRQLSGQSCDVLFLLSEVGIEELEADLCDCRTSLGFAENIVGFNQLLLELVLTRRTTQPSVHGRHKLRDGRNVFDLVLQHQWAKNQLHT